jgi:hypothetical protein
MFLFLWLHFLITLKFFRAWTRTVIYLSLYSQDVVYGSYTGKNQQSPGPALLFEQKAPQSFLCTSDEPRMLMQGSIYSVDLKPIRIAYFHLWSKIKPLVQASDDFPDPWD